MTIPIRDSSREKLCQELELESLKLLQLYQKLCLFFKIERPSYLFNIISKVLSAQLIKNYNNISLFNVKEEYFRRSFFTSNKVDNNIKNSEMVSAFLKKNKSFNL